MGGDMRAEEDHLTPRLAVQALEGTPLPRFSSDRTCAADGCTTRLSMYNGGERCWLHTEGQPLLPLRRRQVRAA
jgi:hypothetical protein